jgi:3'(2'), 5'-bisphosphate nucleotidase
MSNAYTDSQIESDLAFAIQIARSAGERVLDLRNTGRWEGSMLADVGDQAADGYLQGVIQGRYPEDGILSEETVDTPDRLSKHRCWIIDPLDGTKEYCQLREDWGVHVALTIGGQCGIGVVYLPSQDMLIWGVALEGRERVGIEGQGKLADMSVSPPAAPRVVVSRSHTPPWVEAFSSAVGSETMIPFGGAGNKACRLMTGQADIYVHKIGLKEWDTCAPETIARAAGWHVSKLDGSPHSYNLADPHNHEFVMCHPKLIGRVQNAIDASGARD